MTPEQAAKLREEFPRESMGILPKPYKSDSAKGNCNVCGGWHGMPAAHLDYVGHAATTDRLLQVDPEWTWEPFSVHPQTGLPLLDDRGQLWIRLTVAGVTRIGVGDGKSSKELIGDAIRNAAMRFGVALDLWSKEDLQAMKAERGVQVTGPDKALEDAQKAVRAAWEQHRGEWDFDAVAREYAAAFRNSPIGDADPITLHAFADLLAQPLAIEGTVVDTDPWASRELAGGQIGGPQ